MRDFDAPVTSTISTTYPEHAPLKARVPVKKKTRQKKVDTFLPLSIYSGLGTYTFQLPVKAISEANKMEHWTERRDRRRGQKTIIQAALNPYLNSIKLPCVITFKRYGPRLLDVHDNLPMAFKGIVDFVAELLTGKGRGRGDSDPRLSWKYDQEKSKDYGIKIIFEF